MLRAAEALNEGLSEIVPSMPFGLGRILALNVMPSRHDGPRHHDGPMLRMTANLSVGPTYVEVTDRFDNLHVIQSDTSTLIVLRSSLKHRFSNPSESPRASVAIGIV